MTIEILPGNGVIYIAPVAGIGDQILSLLKGDWMDGVEVQILTMDGVEVTESFRPESMNGLGVGLHPRYALVFQEDLRPNVLATLSGRRLGWAFHLYGSLEENGEGSDKIKRMMPDRPALDTHCKYCNQEMAGTNLHEQLCPESPEGKSFHSS